MANARHVATRRFDTTQQSRFAQFSGDRNPMHMDALAARRTQAGVPVVHGMHAVLWALEELVSHDVVTVPISRVKSTFSKLIYVGDSVDVQVTRQSDTELRAQLLVAGTVVTSFIVAYDPSAAQPASQVDFSGSPVPERTWPEQPLELALSELSNRSGTLQFAQPAAAAAELFPFLTRTIGGVTTSALACLSRLVGMTCPGLHSIYSSFDVNVRAGASREELIQYDVVTVDDRFRLVEQVVRGGGVDGTVQAFARVPPVGQPSILEVSALIRANEFTGHTALIIGGSRGLGEVCAKMIAAGGGVPIITYAVGAVEALAVRDEIRAWGGACEMMPYDVRLPAEPQLMALSAAPHSIYYFATAPIFTRKTALYSPTVYEAFHRFYVQGMYELCVALTSRHAQPLSVFYPSSIAVVERPAELTEYAMAKLAGETLCADMTRFMAGVQVIINRLPRILTDQTATVMPVEAARALDVMLPIVREVQRTIDNR